MPSLMRRARILFLGFVALAAPRADASFHTWDTNEVYSNADGTVQFIELIEADGLNGQGFLAGRHYTSVSSDFVFPDNLPGIATADKFFLMATAAFAALPGAVTPDYIIPDGFFSVTGDILSLRVADAGSTRLDTFLFGAGQLPIGGTLSLGKNGVNENSPTNFAGETGFIPEPATLLLLAIGACTTLIRRRPARARYA